MKLELNCTHQNTFYPSAECCIHFNPSLLSFFVSLYLPFFSLFSFYFLSFYCFTQTHPSFLIYSSAYLFPVYVSLSMSNYLYIISPSISLLCPSFCLISSSCTYLSPFLPRPSFILFICLFILYLLYNFLSILFDVLLSVYKHL